MWIYFHRGNHLRCCSAQTWRHADTYTPACVKWIARGELLCSTGNSAWCSVMTQRGGMRGGREALQGADLHILIADSCCCMAETNTILQSTFIFQWKNFPGGKKKSCSLFFLPAVCPSVRAVKVTNPLISRLKAELEKFKIQTESWPPSTELQTRSWRQRHLPFAIHLARGRAKTWDAGGWGGWAGLEDNMDPLWPAQGTMGHRGTLPGHRISFSLVLSSRLKLFIIHPFRWKHRAFCGGGGRQKVKGESGSVVSDSLRPHDYTVHHIFQARILGWVTFPFSRGSSPTQGLNSGLPHCRWILYQLSHNGSQRRLAWVAYPFSSGSSWPRNRTGVTRIAGGLLTNWAIREAKGTSNQYNHSHLSFVR